MSSERRTYKDIEKQAYHDQQSTSDKTETVIRDKLFAIEKALRFFLSYAITRSIGLPDEKGQYIVNQSSDVELGLICKLLVNSPHYGGPEGEEYFVFDSEVIYKLYSIALELSKSAWENRSTKGGK